MASEWGNAAATPGRRTRVYFDCAETVLAEPGWRASRDSHEMAATVGSKVGDSRDVEQLASGWWGLKPINADHFEQHETTAGDAAVLRLSEFRATAHVAEKPTYRKPVELPGALDGAAADLQTSGDYGFWMKRAAGTSWNLPLVAPLALPPDIPKAPRNLSSEPHVAIDAVMEQVAPEPEDMGFVLRWDVPGNFMTKPDWVMRFYFGGALSPEGYGAFCLLFDGNGTVWLYERGDDVEQEPPAVRWALRDHWRFANRQATVNVCHVMQIRPHCARFIEFRSHLEDRAWALLSKPGGKYHDDAQSMTTHLYTVGKAELDAKGSPYVTGRGPVRADFRRDLSPFWQIARLLYRATSGNQPAGLLIDNPAAMPWGMVSTYGGVEVPLTVGTRVFTTGAAVAALKLYNAETGSELASGGTGQYLASGGKNLILPVIEFDTADSYQSPYVAGYMIGRDAQTRAITPGEFEAHGVRAVSITGPDEDPPHETARLEIEDLSGELPRFRKRGIFSTRIETEYRDPLDGTTKTSVLFRGYAKPRAQPRPSRERQFPGNDWTSYEVECVGWWRRLEVQLFTWYEDFSTDYTAPVKGTKGELTGGYEPWKVTDAIHQCLVNAGYPDSMIEVPDLDVRLWASGIKGQGVEMWRPATGSSIGEYIKRIAWEYLGAYVLPDPNAGDDGMWRLFLQPMAGTPLWRFYADPGLTDAPTALHCLLAYPDGGSPILKVEGETTLHTWVEPPEGNAVFVCAPGGIEPGKEKDSSMIAWGISTNGIDWERFGTEADPEHPDYLAMLGFAPVIDVDATALGNPQRAQWMARRLFNQACRARQMASWTGHLVLVADPSDAMLAGKRRPLRYGDCCGLDLYDGNGSQLYIIRSANPCYEADSGKDAAQICEYEAQKVNPGVA